jgi:hypothetical protein
MADMVRAPIAWYRRLDIDQQVLLANAAAYGTILVLAGLEAVTPSDVQSGHGLELVAGIGVATWLAHTFAEVLGLQLRRPNAFTWADLWFAAATSGPIILATVGPALLLALGRFDVLSDDVALWLAVAVGVLQLVVLGAVVGSTHRASRARRWAFVAATVAIGALVVLIKVVLSH